MELMSTTNQPLVSIVVITYNSSKFVVETLESTRAQTYQNIELIISDDCSTDNTIEICKEWIDQNEDRFVRIEIITSPKNTGIAANCNRGLAAVKGEWIKYIAGDDMLTTNCLQLNLEFTQRVPAARFVFSTRQIIEDNELVDRFNYSTFVNYSKRKQVKYILLSNQISATSSFIHSETLKILGSWDETFPMMEDYPMWVKALLKGHKIYGFNDLTCYYRIHNSNISLSSSKIFNEQFHKTLRKFYVRVLLKENSNKINFLNVIYVLYFLLISDLIILNKNRNNALNKWLLGTIELLKKIIQKYYSMIYDKNEKL